MWCKCIRRHRRPQISILVPFKDNGDGRAVAWNWLRHFWFNNLSSAEIVVGHAPGIPFNKAVAVNDAARRARGRIFAILDADALLNPEVIQHCADQIDHALKHHKRLWFMPYDKLYRISREVTDIIVKCDPAAPYEIPSPPPHWWLETVYDPSGGRSENYGHQYGAMAMVMPRQAFYEVEGMDPGFKWGWGSEDASFLKALDTLYSQHEVVHADVLHLWHARPGVNWETRKWVGQDWTPANSRLAQKYQAATGHPEWMRALVNEHAEPRPWWRR